MGLHEQIDPRSVLTLWKAGKWDAAIARDIGCSRQAVAWSRHRLALGPNGLDRYKDHSDLSAEQAAEVEREDIPNLRIKPAKRGQHWRPIEDRILLLMSHEPYADIVPYLPGRLPESMRCRLGLLGVKRLPIPKPTKRDWKGFRAQPSDRYDLLQAATILHLLDLKRAQHSPRDTELKIPASEGLEQFRPYRPPISESRSLTGSSANMCDGGSGFRVAVRCGG